jgi:hypothetical protein
MPQGSKTFAGKMMFIATDVSFYDMVGLIGVSMYVVAYTGVQLGVINGNSLGYTCLNGFAAGCVLFSMVDAFNLSGALVNGLFLTFSLVGLARKAAMAIGVRRRVRVWAEQNIRTNHLSSR